MERGLRTSTQFKRDLKRLQKQGKALGKLDIVVALLRRGVELPPKYRNHPLKGDWVHHMECHLEPDWLLVYQINEEELFLVQSGTHAYLFNK